MKSQQEPQQLPEPTHEPIVPAPKAEEMSQIPSLRMAWDEKGKREKSNAGRCIGWGDYSAKS